MSIRSKVFTALLGGLPANLHRFVVLIPGMMHTALLATRVNCQFVGREPVTLKFWGQDFILPTSVEKSSGELSITVYETPAFSARGDFNKRFLEQESVENHHYFDVYVYSIQGSVWGPPIIYNNCWVKTKAMDTAFGSNTPTQPMTWTFTVVFNGITEPLQSYNTPVPLLAEEIGAIEANKVIDSLLGGVR